MVFNEVFLSDGTAMSTSWLVLFFWSLITIRLTICYFSVLLLGGRGGGGGFAFALIFIFSQPGVKPYPGLTATELMSELRKGYRLEKPNGCSDAM